MDRQMVHGLQRVMKHFMGRPANDNHDIVSSGEASLVVSVNRLFIAV